MYFDLKKHTIFENDDLFFLDGKTFIFLVKKGVRIAAFFDIIFSPHTTLCKTWWQKKYS